jgi:acyl dehydratase
MTNAPAPGAWARTIRGRPQVGATAERRRRISPEDILAFTEMTGDRNPLHYDAELARRSPFGRIIVQGGVTSGLLNALVAEDLPGPGTVFLGVEWSFRKAVGPGDVLTARAEVLAVRDDKPICTLATTILDAAGDAVLTGTATTYTTPLPHDEGDPSPPRH